jgi:type IV pilus assembly protein PilY1
MKKLSVIVFMVVAAFAVRALTAVPEIDLASDPLVSGCSRPASAVTGTAVTDGEGIASESYLYQAGFDSTRWSGSLKRYRLMRDASGAIGQADSADWDAGEVLTGSLNGGGNPAPGARHIYTSQKLVDRTLATVEFKWNALNETQQRSLDMSPVDGSADGLGSLRVEWLRGVRMQEEGSAQGPFRQRERILGDVVHGNPVYVGVPSADVQGDDSYAAFRARYVQRSRAVLVGANDGMLHAFDAGSGVELFAYVPRMLIPKLNRLTSPAYIHESFVDGGVAIGQGKVGNRWRTLAVAGLGAGAQGVIALDVTDPSDFAGGLGAIWEFSDADDADLGNVIGTPAIAKFRTASVKGVPQYRYFAVVSSGVNNYRNDGNGRFDALAPGALFLLALDKPSAEQWKEGVNYYKFKVSAADAGTANGLGAPAIVPGRDGAVRHIYAGDLQGNLWRFDFTGAAPWKGVVGTSPVFIARNDRQVRQSLLARPAVVFGPQGGYVVLFGTGRYLERRDADPSGYVQESFYGVLDTTQDTATLGRDSLARRIAVKSQTGDAIVASGAEFSFGTGAGSKRGWYLDFVDSTTAGERLVQNPAVAYGRVFFSTLIPGANGCGPASGRMYALDALTGLSADGLTGKLSDRGAPLTPLVFETGTPAVQSQGVVGFKTVTVSIGALASTAGGSAVPISASQESPATVVMPAGRFSWREIINWKELHRNAAQK